MFLSSASIKEQILNNIKIRKSRYKAKKFIAYFQSFSNTYADINILKQQYDEAVSAHPDIVGLNISTRPDCIDEAKIQLIASYRKKVPFVCIEYGLQSCHNKTLELINRKETFEDFLKALQLTKKYKDSLHHCVHVILGLPEESFEEQMKTAAILADLRIEGIKIHPLAVMQNTPLADLYEKSLYIPLSAEEYLSSACSFIERLHPECIIHRVSTAGHPMHTIAPAWLKENKSNLTRAIEEEFRKRKTQQGSLYKKTL